MFFFEENVFLNKCQYLVASRGASLGASLVARLVAHLRHRSDRAPSPERQSGERETRRRERASKEKNRRKKEGRAIRLFRAGVPNALRKWTPRLTVCSDAQHRDHVRGLTRDMVRETVRARRRPPCRVSVS